MKEKDINMKTIDISNIDRIDSQGRMQGLWIQFHVKPKIYENDACEYLVDDFSRPGYSGYFVDDIQEGEEIDYGD